MKKLRLDLATSAYKSLGEPTKEEKKLINTRPPSLKITHEETNVKFD